MSSSQHIAVIKGNNVTNDQKDFVNLWSKEYFGEVAVAQGLKKAPVHWRLFLSHEDSLVSHVALTEFKVAVDDKELVVSGAVGGLLTAKSLMGNGYGNALMDQAEKHIFEELGLDFGILFCLAELVPFYERRGWKLVTKPVTLAQKSGSITWSESVMVLTSDQTLADSTFHVPFQN